MEPEPSLSYSQELAILLYPKPDESIPRTYIVFRLDTSQRCFSIYPYIIQEHFIHLVLPPKSLGSFPHAGSPFCGKSIFVWTLSFAFS